MEWLGLIFVYALPFLLLVVAYLTGSHIEKRHYTSIREREQRYIALPVVNFDDADDQYPTNRDFGRGQLVSGSVVVSVDRFKQLLAGLRNLFGGRVGAYESLLDRARREAILRMKEAAGNASLIVNLRVQTAALGGHSARSLGTVEVHAYGTALYSRETQPTTS